MLQVQTTNN